MTTLPASSPSSRFGIGRQKPQAKTLSPAARSLFGKSDPSIVEGMLADVLMSERRKAISEMNFDIGREKPAVLEQQENISDTEKTPDVRRRFLWKAVKSGEAPEYYSRVCSGKRSMIPADLTNYPLESTIAGGRIKSAKRNPSGGQSIASHDDDTRYPVSPLRLIPSHFSDNATIQQSVLLPKPLAVHATSVNALTVKNLSPSSVSSSSRTFQRSPLTQRNQSGFCKALNFITIPLKSPTMKSTNIAEDNQCISTPVSDTSSATAEISLRTPKSTTSANSALKQLKITDMATIRKPRSSGMKARKRLRLHDEIDINKQPKSHKLVTQEGVRNT